VAQIVGALLQEKRDLRVLATSREAIGLDGELRLPLQPFAVPGPDEHDVAVLRANESIALLLDRATAVAPHFQIDASNARALSSLARRFDGLPLALELGAAQLDVFSPEQLDNLLEAHLALPVQSSRDSAARHGSIDAAVDWSYQLLSSAERAVLDRMSVFRGPATLDAVRSVVVDGELIVDHDVLDHVVGLVRRSLVVAVGAGAERRYRLLETTREAGWRRLQAQGRLDEFRDRHFDWMLSRANEAALALSGPARTTWTRELDLEYDNLEAALRWSAHNSHTAGRALDVVSRLIGYWLSVGNRRECGLRTATELVDAATDMEPAQRAEAVMLAGGMALVDDLAAARQLAEAARRCAAGAAPDSRVALIASLTASFPEWAGGDPSAARALAARALSLEGFPGVIAKWVSASCLALEGDLNSAHATILEVAETMRTFGDEHFYGYHLARSADFGHALGVPADQLVPRAREALAIASIQCPSCEGEALSTLALVDTCAEYGGPLRAAQLGLERADELGEMLTVVSDLGLLVGLQSLAGAHQDAAWLHGATTTLRARTGFVEVTPGRLAYHRLGVLVSERSLGTDRFAELSREAADVSYTETIQTALSMTAATTR
jgi:predicted ATPase